MPCAMHIKRQVGFISNQLIDIACQNPQLNQALGQYFKRSFMMDFAMLACF
jgi:hypothetical protein